MLGFLFFGNVAINLLLDGYGVFRGESISNNGYNVRFTKIEYLKKHSFDSFLLGSSRVGTLNPRDIEKYIPQSKFYNLFMHANGAGILEEDLLTSYLVSHYEVKNLFISLDLDFMLTDIQSLFGDKPLGADWHYELSGVNKLYLYH